MTIKKKLTAYFLILGLLVSLVPVVGPLIPGRAAQTWTPDGGNPVFTSNIAASAPFVLNDGGTYKMWYTQQSFDWSAYNAQLNNIAALAGASTLFTDLKNHAFSTAASGDNGTMAAVIDYLASLPTSNITSLLNSTNSTVNYTTSADGATWAATQVVLRSSSGQWDQFYTGSPWIIKNSSNNTYDMYYTGATVSATTVGTFFSDLALLSSDNIGTLLNDLINNNISNFVTHAINSRGDAYMRTLIQDIINIVKGTNIAIGHATSNNGTSWTKDASPVLNSDSSLATWDRYGVANPSVVRDSSGTWHMWYTGYSIDYATMLGLRDATNVTDMQTTVLSATNMAIGHATSTNGVTWTKDTGNPVLARSATASDWDAYGVGTPSVIKNGTNMYEMWYTGMQVSPTVLMNFITGSSSFDNTLTSGVNVKIGRATSTNGQSWTKDTSNPVVTKGSGSVWNKYAVSNPNVSVISNAYNMWFSGVGYDLLTVANKILTGLITPPSDLADLTNYATTHARVAIGHATATPAASTITATADTGGTISPSGAVSVAYGSNQAFTITASSGYAISNVLVDGVTQGAVSTYTFNTVTAPHTIYATFLSTTVTTAATSGNVSVSANLTNQVLDVTATASVNMTIMVSTNSTASVNITVERYSDNPYPSVAVPATMIPRFVDIVVSNADAIIWPMSVNQSYTTSEISGITETSLRMYYFKNGAWNQASDSGVNTTLKYVWANLTRAEVAGSPLSMGGTATSTTTGSSGGGGGAPYTPPPTVYIPDGGTSFQAYTDLSGVFTQLFTAHSPDSKSAISVTPGVSAKQSNNAALFYFTIAQQTSPAAPPAGTSVIGSVYSYGPSGATFSAPVTLTISYDPSALPPGAQENKLFIGQYDASTGWVALTSAVDPDTRTVTAKVSHFSDFALMTSNRPAGFTVTYLSISPMSIDPGGTVKISMFVTNTGDLSGTYTVNLKLNGTVADTKTITLSSGAIQAVVFTYVGTTPGTYNVAVDSTTGTFTVRGATPTPTASATTTTPAAPTGTTTAPTSTLAPTSTAPTLAPTATTAAPTTPVTTTPAKPLPKPGGTNWLLIVGIAVGAIILVVLIILIIRRMTEY